MALRIRRGTNAERLTVTPLEGELVYTTDTKSLYIGDGSTSGGIKIGPIEIADIQLENETTPTLGGDLNLNGNNIIGNGNININGTITATGNITLGDGAEDNILVGGLIASSLTPDADGLYDLGSNTSAWANGYFQSVEADSVTGELFGNSYGVHNGIVEGDVNGSVFGDDSALLVDGVNSRLTGELHANVFSNDGNLMLDVDNKEITLSRLILEPGAIVEGDRLTIGTDDVVLFTQTAPADLTSDSFVSILGAHTGADAHSIGFARSRGSLFSPAIVQDGDGIINLGIAVFDGANFIQGGALSANALVSGGGDITTQWTVNVRNTAGNSTFTTATFKEDKVDFAVPPKIPTFATNAARDAAITAPEAGMLIYVTDYDGVGGGTQAQIYDGTSTSWRVLSWT